MKKQLVKLEDLKVSIYKNHILSDYDYQFYLLFLKKFYCDKFLKTIIDSILDELKVQIKQIPNTEINFNYKELDKEFELELIVEKFNNKELLLESNEKLLVTERIILNSIYEKILNINFESHFEEYTKLLQQVFYDLKTEIMNSYTKLDKEKLDEILYKLLVSIFQDKSIEIEKEIVNENNNV